MQRLSREESISHTSKDWCLGRIPCAPASADGICADGTGGAAWHWWPAVVYWLVTCEGGIRFYESSACFLFVDRCTVPGGHGASSGQSVPRLRSIRRCAHGSAGLSTADANPDVGRRRSEYVSACDAYAREGQ